MLAGRPRMRPTGSDGRATTRRHGREACRDPRGRGRWAGVVVAARRAGVVAGRRAWSDGVSADQLLAIDVGTQSVRALLFDPAGTLVARAKIPIEPYVSPHPGWAENDPELYWSAVGAACRALVADPAVRLEAIAGMALTTQRGTIVVVDREGRPLRPAMVWLDQRRTEGLRPIGGINGLAFRALGVAGRRLLQAAAGETGEATSGHRARRGRYLLLSGIL